MLLSRKAIVPALVSFIALSLWNNAEAAVNFTPCAGGATLFYINGVDKPNDQEVAYSAYQLQQAVANNSVACVADVRYLYNPSDGLLLDVLTEVARQKAAERLTTFSEAILRTGWALMGIAQPIAGSITPVTDSERNQIRDLVSTFIADAVLAQGPFSPESPNSHSTASLVHEFRDNVLASLRGNTKVVLVGHSQGNLFANEAYTAALASDRARASKGLRVVNIANPASSSPNNLYLTSDRDLIIVGLGSLAMPANAGGAGSFEFDWTGHGFGEVYLNGLLPAGSSAATSLRKKVTDLIQSALNSMEDGRWEISYHPEGCTAWHPYIAGLPVGLYWSPVCRGAYPMGGNGQIIVGNPGGDKAGHIFASSIPQDTLGRVSIRSVQSASIDLEQNSFSVSIPIAFGKGYVYSDGGHLASTFTLAEDNMDFHFNVTMRSASQIGGTYTTHQNKAVYFDGGNSSIKDFYYEIPASGLGTWTARWVIGKKRPLLLNGHDFCIGASSVFGTSGYDFSYDQMPLAQGAFEKPGWSGSELVGGCSYGD